MKRIRIKLDSELDDAKTHQDWLRCHEHPEAGGYIYI